MKNKVFNHVPPTTFAHADVCADLPIWYAFVFTTIRHHSLHHSTDYENTRCSFGNSPILLDRIFGMHRDGKGLLVGRGDRRRLSMLEQTLFRVQPLICRYKAGRAAASFGGKSPTGDRNETTATA